MRDLAKEPDAARQALEGPAAKNGARVLGPGRPSAERHTFVLAVPPTERDRVMDAVSELDQKVGVKDVRETVKVRLGDLGVEGARLAMSSGGAGADRRVLDNVAAIRTLAMVQIPEDAYLIVEGETPREHTVDVAIG